MKRAALAVLLAFAPVLFAQTPYLIKDIHPGANLALVSPDILAVAGNRVYFEILTGTNTRTLWVSDGTAAGAISLYAPGFVRLDQPFAATILASDTLTAAEPRFDTMLYATDTGRNAFTIHYEGDANFLPQTIAFDYFVARGQVSTLASVAPTGNVRVDAQGVPTAVVPLVNGEAVATLTNLPASTRTAVVTYLGDSRYEPSTSTITLLERRRAVRH